MTEETSKRGAIAIGVFAAAAIGGIAYWMTRSAPEEVPQPVADPPRFAAADAAATPELPPADGDALLRKLAAGNSSSPLLAQWVAAAVRLITRGDSPLPVISFIAVEGRLSVHDQGGHLYITPASYARYDAITGVFTGIDPAYAGQAYQQLRPYFDSAYAQVAAPGERFDGVLASAIDRLAAVRVPEGPVEVVEKGARNYAFKDAALESLSPAEKHVLRMGAKNGRAFQDWLRRFKAAAGLSGTGKL